MHCICTIQYIVHAIYYIHIQYIESKSPVVVGGLRWLCWSSTAARPGNRPPGSCWRPGLGGLKDGRRIPTYVQRYRYICINMNIHIYIMFYKDVDVDVCKNVGVGIRIAIEKSIA